MLIYWSTKERLTLKLFVSSSSGCILQDIPTEFKKGMDEVTIDVIVFIPLRHRLAALVTWIDCYPEGWKKASVTPLNYMWACTITVSSSGVLLPLLSLISSITDKSLSGHSFETVYMRSISSGPLYSKFCYTMTWACWSH